MSLSVSCHVDQSSYFYWFKMCWSSPWLRILCWGTVYMCILPLQLVFSINVSLSFQKANTTLKSIPFCLISHFSQSLMQPITWNIYRQPKKRINHGIWFNEPCCLFFTLREQNKKKTMKLHQHTASSNMVRNCSCTTSKCGLIDPIAMHLGCIYTWLFTRSGVVRLWSDQLTHVNARCKWGFWG